MPLFLWAPCGQSVSAWLAVADAHLVDYLANRLGIYVNVMAINVS